MNMHQYLSLGENDMQGNNREYYGLKVLETAEQKLEILTCKYFK